MRRLIRDERGRAAVEFVAVVPFVLVAALVAWQLALVGHVAWSAAGAAPSGGRAARSALPRSLRSATRVSRVVGGPVRVSVPIPLVVYRWRTPLRVSASASLGR